MDLYLSYVLLIFGFIFMMSFFALVTSERIKRGILRDTYVGLIFAGTFFFALMLEGAMGQSGLPDGRYVLAGMLVLFFNLRSVVPLLLIVVYATQMTYPHYLVQTTAIFLSVVAVFYVYKKTLHKDSRPKWWVLLIYSWTPTIVSLILSNLFFAHEVALQEANSNLLNLLLAATLMTFVLFYLITREFDREIHLKTIEKSQRELLEQNGEIRALNEEISASEETLRQSYDALNEYKRQLENTAFYNAKTGLMNRDFLVRILDIKRQKGGFKGYKLIHVRLRNLEYYKNALGQSVMESIHSNIATYMKHIFEYENVFDMAIGKFEIFVQMGRDDLYEKLMILRSALKELEVDDVFKLVVQTDIGAYDTFQNGDSQMWIEFSETAASHFDKHKGEDNVAWFNQSMFEEEQYRTTLEMDLQRAIEKNEFYVVYQPQCNAKEETIGLEALLRWKHGKFGHISPDFFIPIAESIGFIDQIGHFVLEEAIHMSMALEKSMGLQMPISVNASFIELMNPLYVSNLKNLLLVHGLGRDRINIEITETAIADQMSQILDHVIELDQSQIQLHLDDFGTGYSSLSHLSSFPVKVVKLDKRFIGGITEDARTTVIIQSVVDLCHSLDIQITAEGVETRDQFTALKAMDCDTYQGYLFSKPLDAQALLAFLQGEGVSQKINT